MRNWLAFKQKLAMLESSGNPKSINTLGYLGLYQFGELAFQDIYGEKLGTKKYNSYKEDISSWHPVTQDEDLKKLYERIIYHFGDYISKFRNSTVAENRITKSGMLAAAHLVGVNAVKEYLDNYGKIDIKDAYGTSVRKYIKEFEGYTMF